MKKFLLVPFLAFAAFSANAQETYTLSPNRGNLGSQLEVTITSSSSYLWNLSSTSQLGFYNSFLDQLTVNSVTTGWSDELGEYSKALVTIPPNVHTGPYDVRITVFNTDDYMINGFTVDGSLSTSIFDYNTQIGVSPNPASQKITLTVPKEFAKKSNCAIYDSKGKEVFRQELKNEKTDIDLSKLPTGIYFVKTAYQSKTYTKKIVKK